MTEPVKCCGVIAEGIVCPICLEWVPHVRHLNEAPKVPSLGDNPSVATRRKPDWPHGRQANAAP